MDNMVVYGHYPPHFYSFRCTVPCLVCKIQCFCWFFTFSIADVPNFED